jgi:2-C-methyl-D-erythritol 4-phosphate cytidylyltransferase
MSELDIRGGAGNVWAVLAAAGRGERLGVDRPKAFARLRDQPLLAESLARLDLSDWVDGIVVAAPPGWEEPVVLLAEELGAGKVAEVVTGAETRAESIRAAVQRVPEEGIALLVHDAARPLLPDEVIGRVLEPLGEGWDGAVPVVPIPDTVKRVRGTTVVETIDREGLAAAQTPQAFAAPALREALDGPLDGATDCASLVEARGGRLRAVAGDRRLVKVTEPADLALVEAWLAD